MLERLQDTSVTSLHLANIRYGKSEASYDAVISAAIRAHAHNFITELEDNKGRKGYDAHVGERGIKLSEDSVRIAIVRVL